MGARKTIKNIAGGCHRKNICNTPADVMLIATEDEIITL
jgi:hypothetical protein